MPSSANRTRKNLQEYLNVENPAFIQRASQGLVRAKMGDSRPTKSAVRLDFASEKCEHFNPLIEITRT